MRVHDGACIEKNMGATWSHSGNKGRRPSWSNIGGRSSHYKSTVKVRILFPPALRYDNFRGNSIAAFVSSVRFRIGGPLIIIWDQIPIHKSYPVEHYVSQHDDIFIESFPPYAPELNPVDYVWAYVKYGRLANYCPTNLNQLRMKVSSELSRVSKRPDLLKSFFHATGLEL